MEDFGQSKIDVRTDRGREKRRGEGWGQRLVSQKSSTRDTDRGFRGGGEG